MKIRLGRILENAARLSGRVVGSVGVTENQRALAGMALMEGIRNIAAEKLPMMMRLEYRRFRPTWTANGGWERGMECWYGRSYWRLEADAGTGAPGTSASGWRKLKTSEVAAFVAFEQPWENTIIDRAGIDLAHFAYLADPKYHPLAAPVGGCRLTELGVSIDTSSFPTTDDTGVTGVWVRFVPRYPNVSFAEWSSTAAYERGEVAYVTGDRDVYQCIADVAASASGNAAPSGDGEHWQAVRVSDDFETYLTRLVAADLQTEDQGKYATKASAERAFADLCARFAEGVGDGRIKTGRFM